MAEIEIFTRSSVADCHVYLTVGGQTTIVFHDNDWHPYKNNAEALKRRLRAERLAAP